MNDIAAVYGFGSFFRNETFNDIDLLVISAADCPDCLTTYYAIRERLLALASQLEFKLHLVFLTAKEFEEAPLRDMNRLVALWQQPR